MADLIDRLRQRSWRLTAQRRAIADVLSGPHLHLTADEVHQRARRALPEVSLATVYNTLNELVSLREVREFAHPDGRKRYDPNVETEHHHLICVECGTTMDVSPSGEATLDPTERYGFDVHRVEMTFFGQCDACSG